MRKRRMSPTEINPKPDSDYRSTNVSGRNVYAYATNCRAEYRTLLVLSMSVAKTSGESPAQFQIVTDDPRLRRNILCYLQHRYRTRSRRAACVEERETLFMLLLGMERPEMIPSIDEENHSAVEFIFKAEGKLDILVHDAALACMDALRNASSVDTDIIKETMEINFYGVIYITQAFLPLLREPVILLISTDMASNTQKSPPNSYLHVVVYSTSKAVANSSSHSRKS
ncbi:short-chain dehydrogenase reductase sdr [Moniliophthora roreri]|nr:short-chain dehydrogenase reductase sdr [Moniliophthora roreri]